MPVFLLPWSPRIKPPLLYIHGIQTSNWNQVEDVMSGTSCQTERKYLDIEYFEIRYIQHNVDALGT